MDFQIFGLNEKGEFVIRDINIFNYKCFKYILSRDQDRKKSTAYKEFAYIYFIADLNSLPNRNGYSKKDATAYAKKSSKLDKTWNPDTKVLEAIEIYKSNQLSPERNLANTLLSALRNSYKVIKLLNDKMTISLEAGEIENDAIPALMDTQDRLLKLASTLPSKIKEFKEAIKKIDTEDVTEIKMRGSEDVIPDSANPNNTL